MYTHSPKDKLSLTAKCPVAIYTDSMATSTALRWVSVSYTHRSSTAGWSFHWCHHCPQPDFLEALGTVMCFITLQPSGRASPFLISYLVGRPKTPNCPVCVLPDTMNCMERKKKKKLRKSLQKPLFFYPTCKIKMALGCREARQEMTEIITAPRASGPIHSQVLE